MRLAISAFLCFHLFGVFVTPNPRSYLNQSVSAVVRPYMNYLGLGFTWGFFAPEPVSPPMFIDYVIAKKGGGEISGRFPKDPDPYFFRDRQNRRLALSRFIMNNDDYIRNMFVRYQCLHEQEIESMRLWRVTLTQPTLEDVQAGKKKMTDAGDYKIEVLGTYYCPEDLK